MGLLDKYNDFGITMKRSDSYLYSSYIGKTCVKRYKFVKSEAKKVLEKGIINAKSASD
jgi:hypothetical protein